MTASPGYAGGNQGRLSMEIIEGGQPSNAELLERIVRD